MDGKVNSEESCKFRNIINKCLWYLIAVLFPTDINEEILRIFEIVQFHNLSRLEIFWEIYGHYWTLQNKFELMIAYLRACHIPYNATNLSNMVLYLYSLDLKLTKF